MLSDRDHGANVGQAEAPESRMGMITVRLSVALQARIKTAAALDGESVNRLCVRLLESWLANRPAPPAAERPLPGGGRC